MAKSNILGIVVEDQEKNDSIKGQALVLFSVKGVLLAVQLYNTNSTEKASVIESGNAMSQDLFQVRGPAPPAL